MSGTVLILGASGRFGRHAAEAFWNAGWRVRIFDRTTDDLNDAAQGTDVIVNAWNPKYTDWERDLPALTQQVIKAARLADATVIIPGNIYVYGRGTPEKITAETPHRATNPLGCVRINLEAAYRSSGVKTIVLRAGDFIDTLESGNWFDLIIAGKLFKNRVTAPGDLDAPHAWAYLPDLARAAVALADKREMLDDFEDVLFPGYTLSLRQLAELMSRATGRDLYLKRMSWLPLWVAVPFWPMGRKLVEMRYLWSMPHRLDGTRMKQLLPNFRETDPLVAVATALVDVDVDPYEAVTRSGYDVAAE